MTKLLSRDEMKRIWDGETIEKTIENGDTFVFFLAGNDGEEDIYWDYNRY